MTNPTSRDHSPAETAEDSSIVLHQEQLQVRTQWVTAGRVRLSRRIITETRTVELTVRREVLVVETDAAVSPDGAIAGVARDGAASSGPPADQTRLVFVLREEVPEVLHHVRAYEHVTAHVGIAETAGSVSSLLGAEVADLDVVRPDGSRIAAR